VAVTDARPVSSAADARPVGEDEGDARAGGRVISIYLADSPGAPTQPAEQVRAVPRRGLEGDRNYRAPPAPPHEDPGGEVTLFEAEVAEAVRRDHGLEFEPSDSRRNLITAGIRLNALVGREFQVGEVRLRGVELCEPCLHLTKQYGEPRLLRALVHRGGLRAAILSAGVIRVGDPVLPG
jgi:MOSC domain-containing protein YiiM